MTKYIAVIVLNLVTPKAAAKRELLFQRDPLYGPNKRVCVPAKCKVNN